MAEEEASMRELQEQLKRSRAKQAELRQLKQAATGAIPDAGSSRSKTASARAPATAPLRAPAAAPARTPAPAPPHAPVADPMQAPAAAAPTAVLAGNPPGGIKEPDPILFTGGMKWIPLPDRKVDQSVKKIREGLGASKGGPQVEKKWLDTLETVRQSIIRCNLDPSRPWKRQDPTKVGRLLPVLSVRIPGFDNFEDNWGALFLVQTRFNHKRGTHLLHGQDGDDEDEDEDADQPPEQLNLDASGLQRFSTSPGPAPLGSAPTTPPRRALTSHDRSQRAAVPTGASVKDPHPPQSTSNPTHTADVPPADPAVFAKPKSRPRPKMRPPPVDDNEPVPGAVAIEAFHARLEPPQQSKLHSQPPANIAAFDATGAADHSAKKTTGSVTSRAKTATASGADATPAQAPTQPTTEPRAPTDDPRVEKPSKPKPRARREPATKKPRPQVPTGQARPENAAIIADPPVDAAGASAPSTSERRIGLRSGRTAATATTAVDQTDAARQTQEFKKRAGPPLIKALSKKAKGKKQAPPSPSPPSELLQPESEERSENDDGFHSPDDA
ncbi:hypothetical protein BDV93DRAFT_529070 [Ceratobasidium sp. AG-I]|nr:hypothetical protein BDV93DRAFT_529070 [Ceratobasidium sp. AG-I]